MKLIVLCWLIMLFYSSASNANFLRGVLVHSLEGQAFYLMLYQHAGEPPYWHLYRSDGLHIEKIIWLQQFEQVLWVFFQTAIPQTFLYINRELMLIHD